MDLVAMIPAILKFLSEIPSVGPIVSKIMAVIAVIGIVPGIATAFVAAWHALVMFLQALSMIPGLARLAPLASVLKADEDKLVSFENGVLLPLVQQLSVLPLPKAPK